MLCKRLVCLAVAKDVVGKAAIKWFQIMDFVVCGFEHCVALGSRCNIEWESLV